MFSANFFSALASIHNVGHSHKSELYMLIDTLIKNSISTTGFSKTDQVETSFGEYGNIIFPYYSFGNIDSLALFGLDELFIFSFYYANRDRYSRVLDIGGNIGLHSILMSKLGWHVTCFEPDPVHCDVLNKNLSSNNLSNVNVIQKAVFDESKSFTFVRVEGNTTGSHIQGVKSNPYGSISEFKVDSLNIKDIVSEIDFIKLDAEGAEANILTAIPQSCFDKLDIMAEISTPSNAEIIFKWIESNPKVKVFTQNSNWSQVSSREQLPTSHKDGSVFITSKDSVPFFS